MRMGVGKVQRCREQVKARSLCIRSPDLLTYPGSISGHHQLSLVVHAGWWGCLESGVESLCVGGYRSKTLAVLRPQDSSRGPLP